MGIHILKTIKPRHKDFDLEEAVGSCFNFIRENIAVSNCRRPRGISTDVTQCTCMRFLADPDYQDTAVAVAEYMVRFAGMTLKTKRELVLEWVKISSLLESLNDMDRLTYMLPGLPAPSRRR